MGNWGPPPPYALPPGPKPRGLKAQLARPRVYIPLVLGLGVALVLTLLSLPKLGPPPVRADDAPLPAATAQATEPAPAPAAPAPKPTKTTKPDKPRKTVAQARDEIWTADGWNVIRSGSLWGKFADKSDYTCGNYPCSYYVVRSFEGCPTALYVEANIEADGVVVGTTNDMLGGLQPNQTAAVHLEDYVGGGNSFRITDVSCY